MLLAALLLNDPGPQFPRWVVPHVLAVTAGEIGHPIAVLVPVKAKNGLRFAGFHIILPP